MKIINKQSNHSHQVKVKSIRRILSSGKMNFQLKYECPFCRILESSDTSHDHFVIWTKSERKKMLRIKKLVLCFILLNTPIIIVIIIRGIKSFYFASNQSPLTYLSPFTITFNNIKMPLNGITSREKRISKQFKDYMETHYNTSLSKKTAFSWINSIINVNIDIHIGDGKQYYDLIQYISPSIRNV